MKPSFSIIIPSRNRAHLIVDALDSVIEQKYSDCEIIVVDDGSTDDTAHLLAQRYPEIKSIQTCGVGPAIARNLGVDAATGEYLVFLDSDDALVPGILQLYADAIEQHNRPFLIWGLSTDLPVGKPVPCVDLSRPQAYKVFPTFISVFSCTWIQMGAFVMSRAAFLAAGGFIKRDLNATDLDLYLSMSEYGPCIGLTTTIGHIRRMHEIQLHRDIRRAFRGLFAIFLRELCRQYPGSAETRQLRRALIASCCRYYYDKTLADSGQHTWFVSTFFKLINGMWTSDQPPSHRLRYFLR